MTSEETQLFGQYFAEVRGTTSSFEEAIREAAASSKISSSIRMEGFGDDPLPYYRAADLLVSPSQIEGLSNVVLEAMGCGLPPLLHDACGSGEVIDDGVDGVVADLTSADKISAAIRNLLGDPAQLAAMGSRAREKVVGQFSLKKMADAYESIYRELADENQ